MIKSMDDCLKERSDEFKPEGEKFKWGCLFESIMLVFQHFMFSCCY